MRNESKEVFEKDVPIINLKSLNTIIYMNHWDTMIFNSKVQKGGTNSWEWMIQFILCLMKWR